MPRWVASVWKITMPSSSVQRAKASAGGGALGAPPLGSGASASILPSVPYAIASISEFLWPFAARKDTVERHVEDVAQRYEP